MYIIKQVLVYTLFFSYTCILAQENNVLEFKEYLGYVKKYHPIAKQAQLVMGSGQAYLMKARGGFDPKIEVDYAKKEFKGTEYYDRLNAAFKVPTWYGIEFKAAFEENEGTYLDPSYKVPKDGLYAAGVSMSLGQGLWINDRMATLKKAKYYSEQTKVDRDILVNEVLFNASLAYFNWLKTFKEVQVYSEFLENASGRFMGVKQRAKAGDIAAIDTVKAKIAFQNRALSLEQSKVKLMKSALELSTFLWMNDNIPVELQPNVIPNTEIGEEIDTALEILGKPLDSFNLENHPKIKSIGYKIDGLQVDKNLKANKLLPKIDVEYNFLTTTPELINSLQTEQYKGAVNLKLPLFLRKERGDLKLAKFKLQDAQLDYTQAQITIKNKIVALYNELESFATQNTLLNDMVLNYHMLLNAEERKFSFGESSLFLINTRESELIDANLKLIETNNKFYTAKAKLFNSLALNPTNL